MIRTRVAPSDVTVERACPLKGGPPVFATRPQVAPQFCLRFICPLVTPPKLPYSFASDLYAPWGVVPPVLLDLPRCPTVWPQTYLFLGGGGPRFGYTPQVAPQFCIRLGGVPLFITSEVDSQFCLRAPGRAPPLLLHPPSCPTWDIAAT